MRQEITIRQEKMTSKRLPSQQNLQGKCVFLPVDFDLWQQNVHLSSAFLQVPGLGFMRVWFPQNIVPEALASCGKNCWIMLNLSPPGQILCTFWIVSMGFVMVFVMVFDSYSGCMLQRMSQCMLFWGPEEVGEGPPWTQIKCPCWHRGSSEGIQECGRMMHDVEIWHTFQHISRLSKPFFFKERENARTKLELGNKKNEKG